MKSVKFMIAVLVAGVGTVCECVWKAFRPLWGRKQRTKVPDVVHERRMKCCRECPIYFRPLGTCGSPLRFNHKGCWCFMWEKAKYDCNCWGYDQATLNLWKTEEWPMYVWPEELNSWPL